MDGASRTIAVTGGTGFIGRVVVDALCEAGHRVVVLARGHRAFEPRPRVELRRCDLAEPVDPALLEGCELLVNLVGIKREDAISFARAHVELPLELADRAEAAGMARMIHVSVAGADQPSPRGGYMQSKAEGEQALRAREGELAITILRPGVVYGPGDDLVRNLTDSVRSAPVFPAPGGGRSPIAAVCVDDVALAVVRCIEREASAGRSYDIVGPEQLELRELLTRVAAHPEVARRCLALPMPLALMTPAAAVIEAVMSDPLITPSQLGLLSRGVVGDPEPARRDLGLEPRRFDDEAIGEALVGFEPRLPSVRLVPDPAAERALAELGARSMPSWRLAVFALVAVAALLIGPLIPATIWLRMAGLELVLTLLALALLGLDWRTLWKPTLPALAWGVGAGLVMWAGAFVVAAALGSIAPELWTGAMGLYDWTTELPLAGALPLLVVIVAGEEFVWRGALGVGLGARLNPWLAVLASALLFTLAHLTTGPPILAIAALLGGGAWTFVAIRSRSLLASFIAHIGWDIAMLWLTPLV